MPYISRSRRYSNRSLSELQCELQSRASRWSLIFDCRYDNKDVFKEGLLELQTRLGEKFYASVQSFGEDMIVVFSSVICFVAVPDVSDAEQQLTSLAHSLFTAEQKEKKKLAKRIIKGIQPLFDDAMQKESDLAGRPFERDVPNLEAILDQKLRTRPPTASSANGVHASIEEGASSGGAVQAAKTITDGVVAKNDNSIAHAPTPEELSEVHRSARDEAADEAAIAAQLGQDTMHVATDADAMDVDRAQTNNATVAPPTPPGSDQDLLGPIHHGGIPWYMKEFDPEGTTVYEERWPGRDVLRDMSEELSELDEEELNGLAGSDAIVPQRVVSVELQELARNQRNRNRGLR
jgi:NuA3 HAT complex component NTO1